MGAVPGGGYAIWNGTSGATPIVAGIAALVRSAHPELDVANVINRITSTAKDAGASGPDAIYGFGLINAQAAVNATVPAVTENPMGSLSEWITIYRRADAPQTPVPSVTPVAPEPEPVVVGPANPLGTVLPTVNQLRNVGIPLGVVVLFGSIAVVVIVTAVRQFKSVRKPE